MNKTTIIAWTISFVGTILWVYGYFAIGNPSLIDWHSRVPLWIADFFPNLQSEIGMALVCAGTMLTHWPPRRK